MNSSQEHEPSSEAALFGFIERYLNFKPEYGQFGEENDKATLSNVDHSS